MFIVILYSVGFLLPKINLELSSNKNMLELCYKHI